MKVLVQAGERGWKAQSDLQRKTEGRGGKSWKTETRLSVMSILSVLQVGRALRDTLHELHILSLHTWKVAKTTRESDIEIVFRVHLYSVFFFRGILAELTSKMIKLSHSPQKQTSVRKRSWQTCIITICTISHNTLDTPLLGRHQHFHTFLSYSNSKNVNLCRKIDPLLYNENKDLLTIGGTLNTLRVLTWTRRTQTGIHNNALWEIVSWQ